MSSARESSKYFVYAGTYGEGIYAFQVDPAGPRFEPLGLAGAIPNPSWITPDRDYKFLYAVSELEGDAEGGVASFSIDRKTADLHLLNSLPSGGVAPCHLTLDSTGKVLLVANYMTGTVSAYPIEQDGQAGSMASLMSAEGHGPNLKRQEGPHAHMVHALKGSNIIYVADLGLDRIRLYRLDPARAALTPNDPPFVQLEPGFGPRHFVFSKDNKFMYLLNELQPRVTVLTHDPATGRMVPIQTVPTLPADFTQETTGAEIALDSAGQYLYTSNRGHDSIQVFAVDREKGMLTPTQIIPVAGKTPRGFIIDPSGRLLIVGGQGSNSLEYFFIDDETGRLTPGKEMIDVPSPVDVKCLPVL
ncbi:MAG: lactonase family protein [Acidobacteriaceae bacterium]|nr:lactonase family protein [Acidobacteriaceae bacterium]